MKPIASAVALLVLLALPAFAQHGSEITVASVLTAMNSRRAEAGLPPLRSDATLDLAAGDRMREMEDLGYWGHQSPDGRSPFTWLRARGYDFSSAGENLATGFDTAEVLTASWMESTGHRANILSPLYSECGIAIIEGSTVRRSSGRSIVVMFGRRQNTAQLRSALAE